MSPELAEKRVGQVTASRIKDMLAEGKGVSRAKYAAQFAAERMTGRAHRSGFANDKIVPGLLWILGMFVFGIFGGAL